MRTMADQGPLTAFERRLRRDEQLREGGDWVDTLARPAVEPFASRLERAGRHYECQKMTAVQLAELPEDWPLLVRPNVWVKGTCVDYVVLTCRGVFLVWSIDCRWTMRQAATVMGARETIQRELGPPQGPPRQDGLYEYAGFPGQVEAVFHSPREGTGWFRHVGIDEESGTTVDIVLIGGGIDHVLYHWHPVGKVGIDREWLEWISSAAERRWWRSTEGKVQLPEPPQAEQL